QAEGAEERSGQLQRGTVQFKHARDENLPTKSGSCLSVRRVAEEEEGGEERQAGGGAPRGLFGPGRPHAERPIRLVQRLQKLGRRPSLPHRPGHQLPCPEPWAPYKALYPWAPRGLGVSCGPRPHPPTLTASTARHPCHHPTGGSPAALSPQRRTSPRHVGQVVASCSHLSQHSWCIVWPQGKRRTDVDASNTSRHTGHASPEASARRCSGHRLSMSPLRPALAMPLAPRPGVPLRAACSSRTRRLRYSSSMRKATCRGSIGRRRRSGGAGRRQTSSRARHSRTRRSHTSRSAGVSRMPPGAAAAAPPAWPA
ncbi:unnamed protein product, partial [Prorocentrum cordatum]